VRSGIDGGEFAPPAANGAVPPIYFGIFKPFLPAYYHRGLNLPLKKIILKIEIYKIP
jgi:hypothetical protein